MLNENDPFFYLLHSTFDDDCFLINMSNIDITRVAYCLASQMLT